MTQAEAIKQLNALKKGDNEATHAEAEEILCEFLKTNGHAAIADAFNAAQHRCEFWYA